MPTSIFEDYEVVIVDVLAQALKNIRDADSLKQGSNTSLNELIEPEKKSCLQDYYATIFREESFTPIHQFALTLLLLLEPLPVLRKRIEFWFAVEESASASFSTPVVHLSFSERVVDSLPASIRDAVSPCKPLLVRFPEEVILSLLPHQKISWETISRCIQQPCGASDFDLCYAHALCKAFWPRKEVNLIACQAMLSWTQTSMSGMKNIDLFVEMLTSLYAQKHVTSTELSILPSITHHLLHIITSEGGRPRNYTFLNGLVVLMDQVLLIITNSSIVRLLHEPLALNTEHRVPPSCTMLYQAARLGVEMCEDIWKSELRNIHPLFSLTRVVLALFDSFQILNEIVPVGKELLCILSTLEVVSSECVFPLNDPEEKHEIDHLHAQLKSALRSIDGRHKEECKE